MHEIILQVLENPKILKVGVGIDQDIFHLQKWQFPRAEVQGVVDLRSIVAPYNLSTQSLAGLTALFLRKRLAKNRRRVSWKRKSLTTGQLNYAATDAFASMLLFEAFQSLFPDCLVWAPPRTIAPPLMKFGPNQLRWRLPSARTSGRRRVRGGRRRTMAR